MVELKKDHEYRAVPVANQRAEVIDLTTGEVAGIVPIDQPAPIPNDGKAIVDLVVIDMLTRKELGISRYGVALQAHNGRNMLRDAYEEALDLAIYLRGALEEAEPQA